MIFLIEILGINILITCVFAEEEKGKSMLAGRKKNLTFAVVWYKPHIWLMWSANYAKELNTTQVQILWQLKMLLK